jgi:predicted  nucleic acid-binding Zn-ribbon protein
MEAIKSFNTTLSSFARSLKDNEELNNIGQELTQALPRFEGIKEEFKAHKSNVSDARTRLSHAISQLIHVKKKITDTAVAEKFASSFEKINEEFKQLDFATTNLDKKITAVEVMLSKSQMLMAGLEDRIQQMDVTPQKQVLSASTQHLKQMVQQVRNYEGKLDTFEDQIVVEMQHMFQGTKRNIQYTRKTHATLDGHIQQAEAELDAMSENDFTPAQPIVTEDVQSEGVQE